MAGLTIRSLSKTFGRKKVIENISFEVGEGEFCILLGPSGCGKSTVLRIIAGLERQDSGEIIIGGHDVSAEDPKERDIAMVFQSYALYPHLSVYENLAFPLRLRNLGRTEIDNQVRRVSDLLGIAELLKHKPRELSGGQRQRVALGRAIVRNPRLFLFDEPLSNLDAKLRSSMRIEIAKLHERLKTSTVYVTHDQIEAMTLGQKIVVMDRGMVQQVGTPREVYEKPANIFVASFIGMPSINIVGGKITSTADGHTFISDDLIIDLGPREALREFAGFEVEAGIRPESIAPGDGQVKGQLEYAEHLGSEVILYVMAGKTRLAAKAPADFEEKAGVPLSLRINPAEVHFFCQGKRIG